MYKLNNQEVGLIGEDIAAKLLLEKGLVILNRNFRCKFGEIDIIAKDRDTVVFVEVKTRKSQKYGAPEEAVDYRKQSKLKQLAQIYMAQFTPTQYCRFDVYSVVLNSDYKLQSVLVLDNCL